MKREETAEMREESAPWLSEPISLRIPSRSEYILLARLLVSQVGQIADFSPGDIYDMKLAVTEAATNVIRHAAVDHFEIEYRARPQVVEITVIDAGGGFSVEKFTAEPGGQGGFGLAVIRSLADEVVLNSTESGTSLRMIRRASSEEVKNI